MHCFRKKIYTSLKRATSSERLPPMVTQMEKDLPVSFEKRPATPPPPATSRAVSSKYRDRALSTIFQLRGGYQLSHDEHRILAKNPDLKMITIRAGIALQEAQRNLRNLKVNPYFPLSR